MPKKSLQKQVAAPKNAKPPKPLTPAQRKSVSTLDGQGMVINGERTNFIPFKNEK